MNATTHTAMDEPNYQTLADKLDAAPVEAIDTDDVLDLLANERRRALLAVLADRDGGVHESELADVIASITEATNGTTPDRWRKTTYVTLHQNHIPKLEDYDVVQQDAQGVVTLGPNADAVLDVQRRISQTNAILDAVSGVVDRVGDAFSS